MEKETWEIRSKPVQFEPVIYNNKTKEELDMLQVLVKNLNTQLEILQILIKILNKLEEKE